MMWSQRRPPATEWEGAYFEIVTDEEVAAKLAALERFAPLKISDGIKVTNYRKKPYFRREAIVGKMACDGVGAVTDYAERPCPKTAAPWPR